MDFLATLLLGIALGIALAAILTATTIRKDS